MAVIIALIVAYLLGSLSSAILLAKFMQAPDPRTVGSGSAGATNTLRTLGKNQALFVLIADGLKGLIAVWIAKTLGVHGAMLGFVALAAVVGHVFPLYFKFKGGKGVATAIGSVVGLSFFIGILLIIIWFAIGYLTRYSSLASLVCVVAAPILVLIFSVAAYTFPLILMAALIIWKHQENIQRLRNGTESKMQF